MERSFEIFSRIIEKKTLTIEYMVQSKTSARVLQTTDVRPGPNQPQEITGNDKETIKISKHNKQSDHTQRSIFAIKL